jgi:aminoglycoside 3-N-acetyltransferase
LSCVWNLLYWAGIGDAHVAARSVCSTVDAGYRIQMLESHMSEEETIVRIQNQPAPATVESLRDDLVALGIEPGMTLLVHSSLSALGWVCGGAVAVILALESALEETGTLVMPTHSGDLSDPGLWENPPAPQAWWETIRQTMPAFDPDMTPTRGMGVIPETFRKQRGVLRSNQPRDSFAARGPHAGFITANHSLAFGLGDGSPLARLYDCDARVLLLGVGHGNNTSLHLAEYRGEFAGKRQTTNSAPLMVDGRRQWMTFQDFETDTSDFERIGADFARDTGMEIVGKVAGATGRLFPQRALVDYAIEWMARNRRGEE